MGQKRLGRRTVHAVGLLFALIFAMLGVWVLSQDEHLDGDVGSGAAASDGVSAPPEVVFDQPSAALVDPVPEVAEAPEPAPAEDAAKDEAGAPKKASKKAELPGLIRGRVLDRAGLGVAEATVSLRQRRRRGNRTQVTTDAYGAFVAEVPAGRYVVSASKHGFAPSESARVRLRSAGDAQAPDLLLPPACSLRGLVSSGGLPVSGARVSLDGERLQRSTETDADGRFQIDGLREGLYTVSAGLEGYVAQTERNVPVTEEGGGEIAFSLAAGAKLSGLLRQSDGAPLAKGLVFAFWGGRRLGMTRSDAQGRYELDGLVPGPIELFARSEDYAFSTRSQAQVAAGAMTVQDLVLVEGPQIVGTLRDARGEPVAKRMVRASSQTGDVRREDRSDAQGRYAIKNLYPGRYELTVGAGGQRWGGAPLIREQIDVVAGRTERNLVLPEGAGITGRVVDPVGKPVKGANVFAIVGTEYRGQTRSASDGTFSIQGLPSGEYQVFIRLGDDRMVGLHPLTLQEGISLNDLELLVREPAKLRGRVLDPQGQPLAGVVLDVRGGESPVRRRATSDAEGRFTIGPLYDGAYELRAREGPLALLARKWSVQDARVEPFRFTIAQGRSVERDVVVLITQ